jgi:alpha-tubulin suppressor-like RCC1 family protein
VPVFTQLLANPISRHTCVANSLGSMYCWGYNANGRLGDGTTTTRSTAVAVSGMSSGVTAITSGSDHTCALTSVGSIYCWGSNANGRLGNGTTTDRYTAEAVTGMSSGVAGITAGNEHTCAMTSGGSMYCWGLNLYGQLGDGTTTDRYTAVVVSGMSSGVTAITAGLNIRVH